MTPPPTPPPSSIKALPREDLTCHIGTLFPESVQLSSFLEAKENDSIFTDLARLISERGVVFFKNQDINITQMKEFGRRLGSGTGLHKHPISEDTPETGVNSEVSVISSMGGISRAGVVRNARASNGWHADITFENVPSDYAMLRMHTLPKTGGDTLWASGYEAYDKLSPAFRKFLEGLTAEHAAEFFVEHAQRTGIPMQDPRGCPENTGSHLTTIHPVIRTHPITGWKTLFVNKTFTRRILELHQEESDDVLEYLSRHVSENHDMQVRFRWGLNDLAIWDNRCTFHTATNDYPDSEARTGNRVVSLGERPYYDPKSVSRRESLQLSF